MPNTDPVVFDFSSLRRVVLNATAAEVLPALLASRGTQRAVIIASRSLHRNTPAVAEIRQALGRRCVALIDGVAAHTPRSEVLAALSEVRAADADLLLSIGGGSVIDAVKTIQFCINGGISGERELLAHARFGDGSSGALAGRWRALEGIVPLRQIALPTTLSGAEFSDKAGVTDTDRGAKEGYQAPGLCAETIVYDPVLCRHTPRDLWLSTAIRALDHAVEGYCSPAASAYMQGHFLHAIRLFSRHLPAVSEAPDGDWHRHQLQQATWLACCALGKLRFGASHGIGYILGARCGVPHGHTSCVMLPAVLEWNASVNEGLQRDIAAALGDVRVPAWELLRDLLRRLGLPLSLQDVGVADTELPALADAAWRHPVVRANPRPIESAEAVLEILHLAAR